MHVALECSVIEEKTEKAPSVFLFSLHRCLFERSPLKFLCDSGVCLRFFFKVEVNGSRLSCGVARFESARAKGILFLFVLLVVSSFIFDYWNSVSLKLDVLSGSGVFTSLFCRDTLDLSTMAELALWWDSEVQISILYSDKNVIDSSISTTSEGSWFCSFIYGPSYREEKREFWERMSSLRENSNNPWCIMGDSNIVLSQDDKFRGNLYDLTQANWLKSFMDDSGLLDMQIIGGAFTWTNLRSDDDAIIERLDRIMFNPAWLNLFSKAVGISEPAIGSDHCSIICFLHDIFKRRKRDFKFESKWLLKEECKLIVSETWNKLRILGGEIGICRKLKKTRFRLQRWSKSKYGQQRKNTEELSKQISQ
ncbi:hypothetical protein V6N12_007056 [Hibiscus sabdariffa]|uniref:Endonuclease/exonuclease/phosphatase domain-containing protein n=1 Tax=Hibiscus sabdariffa TaxID=183260 RepID=A0ABR2F0P9_9ROSI